MVTRLVVMMYVCCRLSLRNVEDLLLEHGIGICHDTVRLWWHRFGPLFATGIRIRARLNLQPVGFAALRVNQERHLVDRQTYRRRHSAALAEWRNVMA